jgi:hypothetical protein
MGSGHPAVQRLASDISRALAGMAGRLRNFAPYLRVSELPRDGTLFLAIVTDEVGGETLAYFAQFTFVPDKWFRCQDETEVVAA